jgi:hypothetical protein
MSAINRSTEEFNSFHSDDEFDRALDEIHELDQIRDDLDPYFDPEFETTEDEVLKTSQEWCNELGLRVIDADGWDRNDFIESWSELISREEFDFRITSSTVSHIKTA